MSAPIVVTGAASGIGLALTELLVAGGDQVIGLDRVPCGIDNVRSVTFDLADPASLEAAVSGLPERLGGLANVAGVPGTQPPERVLAVNLLGTRLLTELVTPRLEIGAAVVNVASVAAHRNLLPPEAINELITAADLTDLGEWLRAHPLEGPAAYDTSKRALVDWTQLLAARLLPRGIRALSVSPGPIVTPILRDFEESMGKDAIDRSAATVGRHGSPGEIAAVVAFALSPAASWLNGIDIPVEGGLTAVRAAATSTIFEGIRA